MREKFSSHKLTTEVTSYIPDEVYLQYKESIDRDFIHREGDTGEVLMHASDLLAVIPPGGDLDLNEIPLCDSPVDPTDVVEKIDSDVSQTIPIDEVAITVRARWLPPDESEASSASNANVFGRYGTYQVVDYTPNLVLPTVDVDFLSESDLASYGAKKLTPKDHVFHGFNTFDQNLFLIVYNYSPEYVEKYVLNKELGGGWFIETHNFPHIFKPMSPDCGGSCIIGKLISSDAETGIGTYKLVSVKVQFPNTLAIESEVIHGNSGFTGPYAIPSNPNGTASIVLIHDKHGEIQSIDQPDYQVRNPNRLFQEKPSTSFTPVEVALPKLSAIATESVGLA